MRVPGQHMLLSVCVCVFVRFCDFCVDVSVGVGGVYVRTVGVT